MANGRTCNRCGQWKEATHFAALKGGVNGLYPKCNECRKEIFNHRYRTEPEFRQRQQEYVERYAARRREARAPAREAAKAVYERVVSEMYTLYASGLSMREVGARFDLTESGVEARFLKAGLPRRPRKEMAKPWLPDAIAAYETGESGNAVARRYGVSEGTVYRALRLAGVTIRKWHGSITGANGVDIPAAEPITLGYMTAREIATPGRGHWDIDAILTRKEEYNAALAREVTARRYVRVAA